MKLSRADRVQSLRILKPTLNPFLSTHPPAQENLVRSSCAGSRQLSLFTAARLRRRSRCNFVGILYKVEIDLVEDSEGETKANPQPSGEPGRYEVGFTLSKSAKTRWRGTDLADVDVAVGILLDAVPVDVVVTEVPGV
jgi:hypothetical protein